MKFMGTEMHLVTFMITMFEAAMLFFQVIYFLERPSDKKRLLFLILLLSFILYNVTSGLFPDPNIHLSITIQNVIAYFCAFATSMYFVYYYYKAFNLKHLKFFVTFGSVIFLLCPFLFLFAVPYVITGNLDLSRRLVVVVPFLYGIAFIVATTRAFIFKFKEREYSERTRLEMVLAAYVALFCWLALPVIVYFGDYQVLEQSITNSGLLMMSIVYVRSSIHQSRKEYRMLLDKIHGLEQQIDSNCEKYKLTSRESEIVGLIAKGRSYKIIAADLEISERTVAKHVSNIFAKVSATNKVELLSKLGQLDIQEV